MDNVGQGTRVGESFTIDVKSWKRLFYKGPGWLLLEWMEKHTTEEIKELFDALGVEYSYSPGESQ